MADTRMRRVVLGPIEVQIEGLGQKTVQLAGPKPLHDFAGHAYILLAKRILIMEPGGAELFKFISFDEEKGELIVGIDKKNERFETSKM